jgi:WD40 repeat protein
MAVTEDQYGMLILWDITNRSAPARLATLQLGPVGNNVPQWTPTTPALSPDARTLVTAGPAGVTFWNLTRPRHPVQIETLPGGSGTVFAAAFSPQGNILVTGSDLGGALTWDVADPAHPRQLGALPASPGGIRALAFDRTGRTLLGASNGAVTAVWDMQDPARPVQLAMLRGHTLAVFAVAISPDGHIAVTGGYDNTAVLWDITDRRNPRQLRVLYSRGWVDGIAFDPSGRLLLTADQMDTVTEWDIAALTRIVAHPVEQACAISGGPTPQEWRTHAPDVAYQNVCGRRAAALDNSG